MPVACGARLRCSATRACSRAQLRERVVDFVSALALAALAVASALVIAPSPFASPVPSPLIIPPLLFACLRLCLLLRLCSCRGGGSPAHSRVSVAALGLALASALVIAPSPIASPALSPASAASVALWLTRARASPLLPLGSHSPLPSSSRPRSSSRQRRRCPCLRALARSGLQEARRGGARIRPAALRLQEADPSQEYVAKGCPGMTACSSHSPWPFWPVSPPFWSLSSGCFGIFLT